ncbi:trimeric LpxA-like protein, partial [Rozella allomycis CSF55]
YDPNEIIQTDSGNKISRKSTIYGSQSITIAGKTIVNSGSILRGDLKKQGSQFAISIGKYCYISKGVKIIPPARLVNGIEAFYPIRIGDHVYIGENSQVKASSIGSNVYIGKNCVIGEFVVIKDGAYINDNTTISPHAVIPSWTVWYGKNQFSDDFLAASFLQYMENLTRECYFKFLPKSR